MSLRCHLTAQVDSWLPALPSRADHSVMAHLPSLLEPPGALWARREDQLGPDCEFSVIGSGDLPDP